MTPFQEFRLWLKRAPFGERLATGVAFVLVLAVMAWLFVPQKASTGEDELFAGPAAGAEGPAVVPGRAGVPGATNQEGGGTGGLDVPAGTPVGGTVSTTTTGTRLGATPGSGSAPAPGPGSAISTTGASKGAPPVRPGPLPASPTSG